MSNQYLGWGLVGTPDGRYSYGEGVELARQFANKFDLPSDIGECLVSPNSNTLEHPLFRIRYMPEQQILGFGHYVSVFEHSTRRTGSFCGSFLLTTANRFPQQGINVYKFLLNLTRQHLEQAVDPNTFAYQANIRLSNLNLALPRELLESIHNNFIVPSLNFDSLSNTNKSVVIFYEREKIPQLIDLLLTSELFKCFDNIYFTCSMDIVRSAQANGFICWNSEQINGIVWSIKELVGSISNIWIERIERISNDNIHKIKDIKNYHDNELSKIKNHCRKLESDLRGAQDRFDLQINRAAEAERKLEESKRKSQAEIYKLQCIIDDLKNNKNNYNRTETSTSKKLSNSNAKNWQNFLDKLLDILLYTLVFILLVVIVFLIMLFFNIV